MTHHLTSPARLIDVTPPSVTAPRLPAAVVSRRHAWAARIRPWHLRHRWEVTGGDDAHQLAFTCAVCARTRRSAGQGLVRVPTSDAELRRMR